VALAILSASCPSWLSSIEEMTTAALLLDAADGGRDSPQITLVQ
jgi:hypothetical protein